MKKLNYVLGLLLLVAAFSFSSCTEEEGVGPTLEFISGSGFVSADATVEPGEVFTVKINVTAGDKSLKYLNVSRDGSALTGYNQKEISGDTYQEEIELTAPSNAGEYIYSFGVIDKDDLTDVKYLTITVEESGTPFATEVTTGKIYHLLAPEMASWNLNADQAISSSSDASLIYIQNNDAAGSYTGKFQSKNSTGFVKVTIDYATATKEEATTAYNAGTSSTSVNTVAANDVFVAMKGSELYLIKITNISTTDGTSTAGNKGSMSFTYKK